MSCHGDALLSPQQVVCRLLFALDCCGLCLDPGVQTVPAVNTGSILLNVHPHAPGQAHSKQEEVSCMVEVPLISSLPPAFFFCCFAPFLLSQSDRTQISKYHLSFYYFFSWCRTLLLHLLVSPGSPSLFHGQYYLPLHLHTIQSFFLSYIKLWSISRNPPISSQLPSLALASFLLMFPLRGLENLCLLPMEIFLPFALLITSLSLHKFLKKPPLSPWFFLFVHSHTNSLLSTPMPASSQIFSCYLLASCAMLQPLSSVWRG